MAEPFLGPNLGECLEPACGGAAFDSLPGAFLDSDAAVDCVLTGGATLLRGVAADLPIVLISALVAGLESDGSRFGSAAVEPKDADKELEEDGWAARREQVQVRLIEGSRGQKKYCLTLLKVCAINSGSNASLLKDIIV